MQIVNAGIYYMRSLSDHQGDKKVWVECTWIVIQLVKAGKSKQRSLDKLSKLSRRNKAKNYLKHDMIFLPLNHSRHWYLSAVNPSLKEIHILDSLHNPAASKESSCTDRTELSEVLQGMERYMELLDTTEDNTAHTNAIWTDFKVSTWKRKFIRGLPQQRDGSSCGLFMLKLWRTGWEKSYRRDSRRLSVFPNFSAKSEDRHSVDAGSNKLFF
ncbi:putative ubiquitin-like-specific protease 1B isoform X2 [Brachypodium distachyon]|uniref:putative ubiquitin-like-specific protease 1B isoform X2 n=1 Tax=Brachypodium distachyon TaxID=15368 RepID=UPI00071CBA97|nr:putative ubiquitin-like-specific protease 1B isoform X2 [Brachypodium distachyon]|eukprot:XP_024311663.1 putative ubiquitin-like-specific protease 1B isoform X2 [Brachypodium distachyon]